jgi:hypothetical protein
VKKGAVFPADIQIYISDFLTVNELVRLRAVSRAFLSAARARVDSKVVIEFSAPEPNDSEVWRPRLKRLRFVIYIEAPPCLTSEQQAGQRKTDTLTHRPISTISIAEGSCVRRGHHEGRYQYHGSSIPSGECRLRQRYPFGNLVRRFPAGGGV